MLYTPLKVAGAYEISVERFEDGRGFFARVFNHPEALALGFGPQIVQVNNSFNKEKGTLRGLHYQVPPHQESKIVRALQGALWDVILDLRKDSPTFGQWDSVTLTAEDRNMVLVPAGCAHGILTLRDDTEMLYFVSEDYHPESERCLRWNDPTFGIDWPASPVVLSDKDRTSPFFDPEYHLW